MAMARATFGTSGKYKTIHPGHARLTEFVTAAKADILNKYTEAQLEHHTEYIRNFVRTICLGFGEYNKLFKTKDPIPRGSYFEKTKIISPTEYDFLNILSQSDDASVQVCDVRDGCLMTGGYGVVNIHPGQVQQQFLEIPVTKHVENVIPHSSHDPHSSGDVYWLTTNIRYSLRDAIHTYLEDIHGSHYIGKRDHKEEQHPSYTLGKFSMHVGLHGPSVWLRVGGPLGTTDIDLCFCAQKTQGSILVPAYVDPDDCDECPEHIHWTESIVQPPYPAPDHLLHIPTGHHKQLFLLLKYVSHLYNTIYWHIYHKCPEYGLISSYSYKLLIMQHRKCCTGSDFYVGRCFEDVVEYIFNQYRRDNDVSDQYRLYRKPVFLPDTYYPARKVHVLNSYRNCEELTELLWMLKHVKHSSDTQWWQKLLDDDFPNTAALLDEVGKLESASLWKTRLDDFQSNSSIGDNLYHSLLDSFKRVKHVYDERLSVLYELPEPLDWQHEDGTRTHLTFIDE
ncbi:unnamed protein product [Owenia fusiformis]|uniref:Uncharacterized protein n=1 Tax=Owenia fusiformis TaxID=6347 RepID=A0A8J1TQC9_OWEFU|nr:unnamed protein product [Owenia fusiformis]